MRNNLVISVAALSTALFAVGCSGVGTVPSSAAIANAVPRAHAADGGGSMPGASVRAGGAYHLVKSPNHKSRSAKRIGFMREIGLKGNVLYIADAQNDVVNVYRQGGGPMQAPIGQISGLEEPTGLAVAANGDLYVSNYDNNVVSVFHRGQTAAYETLNAIDTNAGGNDIAVGSGNVYVGNLDNIIQVFSAGATSPTSSLVDSNLNELYSVAVDSNGDVFDTGDATSGGTVVDEFPAGSSAAITLPIALSSGCASDGGLIVDAGDNLYVNDCGSGIVSEYAAPYTGSPVRQLLYGGTPAYGIAITPSDKNVWLASFGAEAGLEYNITNTRLHDRTSSSGLAEPYGMAVNPPNGN